VGGLGCCFGVYVPTCCWQPAQWVVL
jgi:hypothetical protein